MMRRRSVEDRRSVLRTPVPSLDPRQPVAPVPTVGAGEQYTPVKEGWEPGDDCDGVFADMGRE